MFTFNDLVSTYTRSVKQINSFVTHEELRKNLDQLVDRQAEFATGAYEAGTLAVKTLSETVSSTLTRRP